MRTRVEVKMDQKTDAAVTELAAYWSCSKAEACRRAARLALEVKKCRALDDATVGKNSKSMLQRDTLADASPAVEASNVTKETLSPVGS